MAAERKGNTSKIHCDIDEDVKIRIELLATKKKQYLWQVVEEALIEKLDKEGKIYNV